MVYPIVGGKQCLLQLGRSKCARWVSGLWLTIRMCKDMGLILLIILILLLVGGVPAWPYSREWGYGPSGIVGVVLLVVIVLLLLGYIPRGF